MTAAINYPVVVINWVHYLGPPGPSTSQILGTFSRFSETLLAERGGGSLGDPPGPSGILPRGLSSKFLTRNQREELTLRSFGYH